MKTSPRTCLNLLLGACLAAVGAVAMPAAAEEEDLAAKLHEAVAALSEAQQRALLLLLTSEPGAAESGEAAQAKTPLEALTRGLNAFEKAAAGEPFEMEDFFAHFSEEFQHPALGNKDGLRSWIRMMSSSLFRDGKPLVTFDISDVEIDIEGDKAYAYPVDVSTPLGGAAIEIVARQEEDGVWRIIAIEGV